MRHDTLLGRLGAVGMLSLGYQVLHITGLIILLTLSPQEATLRPDHQPVLAAISEGQPMLYNIHTAVPNGRFRGLDGRPMIVPEAQQFSAGGDTFSNEEVTVNNSSPWSANSIVIGQNYTEPWFFIQEQMRWNFTGYFVAYSSRTRTPVLYIGANGVSTYAPSVDQRFQMLRGYYDLMTNEGQTLYDYANRGFGTATTG